MSRATAVQRGQIWWADLVAVITANLNPAKAPGNVLLPATTSGLPRDSVVNVSQLFTLDRQFLSQHVSTLSQRLQSSVDSGLRLVLDL